MLPVVDRAHSDRFASQRSAHPAACCLPAILPLSSATRTANSAGYFSGGSLSGYGRQRRAVLIGGRLLPQRFVRALLIELMAKLVKAPLLRSHIGLRRSCRFLLQRPMHPLMRPFCCGSPGCRYAAPLGSTISSGSPHRSPQRNQPLKSTHQARFGAVACASGEGVARCRRAERFPFKACHSKITPIVLRAGQPVLADAAPATPPASSDPMSGDPAATPPPLFPPRHAPDWDAYAAPAPHRQRWSASSAPYLLPMCLAPSVTYLPGSYQGRRHRAGVFPEWFVARTLAVGGAGAFADRFLRCGDVGGLGFGGGLAWQFAQALL